MKILSLAFVLILMLCYATPDEKVELHDGTTLQNSTYYDELEKESESIVKGIMDALSSSFFDDSSLADGGKNEKGDVIIEQEEKNYDKDGNLIMKKRTLKNPTKEELETKTLDELENDDGPDVTTIRTFKIKLKENDMSDHSFSSFNLDNPKAVEPPVSDEDQNRASLFKSFIWFSIKMAAVVGVGCLLFSVYRAYIKNSQASKRRYNSNRSEYSMTNSDDDEEELKNVKNAIRKGGITNGSKFNSHDD